MCRSSRRAVRARPPTWWRPSSRAAPTPSSPRRSSIAASTRSPRSRPPWRPRACRCGPWRRPPDGRRSGRPPLGRGWARPGHRAGRRGWSGADARLARRGGSRRDAGQRPGPLPLPLPRPAVAEGREERQRPAARRARPGLRPRRAPGRTAFAAGTPQGFGWLETLWATIGDRAERMPPDSYTTSLLRGGVDAVARKVAEEAVEVVIAAKDDAHAEAADADRPWASAALAGEVADLLYHALVLCAQRGLSPSAVLNVLRGRHVA